MLYALLSRPDCTLQALSERDDGRWQPDNAPGFARLVRRRRMRAERHTEYHHQWADIQVVLAGEELIYAGARPVGKPDDEERKADLFIASSSAHSVGIRLGAGDFAVFSPGEPHRAASGAPMTVRKAVFKVPRSMLEV